MLSGSTVPWEIQSAISAVVMAMDKFLEEVRLGMQSTTPDELACR